MNPQSFQIRYYMAFFNILCIPITFNNMLKACLFNKKYLITIQTRLTQIVKVYFLFKNQFLKDFQDNWCTKSINFLFKFSVQ